MIFWGLRLTIFRLTVIIERLGLVCGYDATRGNVVHIVNIPNTIHNYILVEH